MKKNVASQVIAAQLNALTDGAPVTSGTTTVYVTGDAGTQGAGGGTVAHEGQGCWSYIPTQAETNYDHIAFTFQNSSAISQTVNVYTTFPQTGDNFARLGAPAGASVSADVAAVKAETATIQSDTNDIQTRLPAALVSGRIDASVGAMASAVLTATAIASDAITDAKVASDVTIASVTGSVGSVTGNVGGNVTGSVGSVATGGISASSFAANAIDAAALAASAVAEIADGVWDEAISGHLGAGSTGAALNAAGSAGDPWTTPLPGAYGSGTAGFIIGTNIDALISSRLASASYTAPLDAAGTATAVWNAATATYGSAGSYGLLIETNVDAQISTRSTLDAAGVRSAVGLASANLDTQLDAIPTATENADALLNRDMSAVSDTNSRSPLNALRFLRNKWSISGTTLTVTKENDVSLAWVATVSTDAAAEPVVGSDPS